MGGNNIILQKLSSNVTIYGFVVLVITLITYTFVTKKGIIPVNLIYEKNQEININLPQTNDKINIKYHKAVEGKNYLKLVNTFASLENNYDAYNIEANLVLTRAQSLSKFDKLSMMIFPVVTISNIQSDTIQSGFTFLKNNFLFFDNTVIKKQDNINIFSANGKKMDGNIYLNRIKINTQNYKILSYDKVIYSKKSLQAVNAFVSLDSRHTKYTGVAKILKVQLLDKKHYIGKATKLHLNSYNSKISGNLIYFEQHGKDTCAYILNGFNFESENFSIKTYSPVFILSHPRYTNLLFYSDNLISGKNFDISGNNIKVIMFNKKVKISSHTPLKISLQKGVLFANRIVFYTERQKYKLEGLVTGFIYGLDQNIELKGDNLIIKETRNTLRLYSHNPIVFKTKENVIKAKKAFYDKAKKKFAFLSGKFSVCVNKLTAPKIKIFSEKLTIQKDNSILLSNKFLVRFLEKSNFESFAGFGIASLAGNRISMIGSIHTKITASQPISYTSRRQYINLGKDSLDGFSKDNVFFYNNSKFFADTLNIKRSSAKICNKYGVTITYLYNTRISTKCMKYYFDREKLVLPKGKITK